jgi:hypothetical protein
VLAFPQRRSHPIHNAGSTGGNAAAFRLEGLAYSRQGTIETYALQITSRRDRVVLDNRALGGCSYSSRLQITNGVRHRPVLSSRALGGYIAGDLHAKDTSETRAGLAPLSQNLTKVRHTPVDIIYGAAQCI